MADQSMSLGGAVPVKNCFNPAVIQRKISVARFRESRRYIINPEESSWLRRWEMFVCLALCFLCFVTPYEVGFIHDDKDIKWLARGANSLFWINRVVDLAFIADMCMQFFIMYPVPKRFGSFYVSDRVAIVKHYLSTWFVLDLISVIPFELIGIVVASDSLSKLKAIRAIKLVRLLKLMRLLRGLRILRHWEEELSFSYRRLTIWGLLVTVCLAAHWMSCSLGMLNIIQGQACWRMPDAPEDPTDCLVTWFTSFAESLQQQGLEVTSFRTYLAALHVTATILVHPYQGTANSEAEQVCFTILVFTGGFIWTRVISRTTAVQTSLDRHGIYYRQTMDDLNNTASEMMLSDDLQKRLRSFFMNMRDSSQRTTWSDLNKRMSPSLRTEVAVALHKGWLKSVSFLVGSSRHLIADLAGRIYSEHFAQKETFGSNFRLYVMCRGLASRTHGFKSRIRLMLPGTVWGLEHLVFCTARLLEPNTSTTATFCEVLVLTREAFEQVKVDYPENNSRIRKFYVKMVVIRGVITYARQYAFNCKAVTAPRGSQTTLSSAGVLASMAITDDCDSDECDDPDRGDDQHIFHRLRMKRDMTRRFRMQHSRRSLHSRSSAAHTADDVPHGERSEDLGCIRESRTSSVSTDPLQAVEERLAMRIDARFSALEMSIDALRRELRDEKEASEPKRCSQSSFFESRRLNI